MGSYQEQKEEKLECTFYQNEVMNEYICKLDVYLPNLLSPEFIFIVDKSGSMGSSFNFIITKTIPNVLNSLGYENTKIHLITFDDKANYYNVSQSELKNLNLNCGGNTYMAKTYEILKKIFISSKGKCNNLRILAISDGKLHDQNDTKDAGKLLYNEYKNNFKINSQAIRLKTSSNSNPDTTGISSILIFNNTKGGELVNHKAEEISSLEKVITELFKDDGFIGSDLKIKGDDVKLKNFPWEKGSNSLPLKNGIYTFFSDKKKPLYISNEKINIPIKCEEGNKINNCNYESVIGKDKKVNIFQLFKFNKTLDTNESKAQNKLILDYFKNLSEKTNDKNLKYLKEKLELYDSEKINDLDEDSKSYYVKNIDKIDEKQEIKKYEKDFDENSFWNKIKGNLKKIGVKPVYAALILYYAIPKVSLADKAIIIGALGYLISPFDLIPDFIPIIGYMDDIGILVWAAQRIYSNVINIDPNVIQRAKEKVKELFGDINEEELTI
jgi:uncharacterized membrane protein YkvA (DUF1232 family)